MHVRVCVYGQVSVFNEQDHGLFYFTLLLKNKHISETFNSIEELTFYNALLKMKKSDHFQSVRNENIDSIRLLIFPPELGTFRSQP